MMNPVNFDVEGGGAYIDFTAGFKDLDRITAYDPDLDTLGDQTFQTGKFAAMRRSKHENAYIAFKTTINSAKYEGVAEKVPPAQIEDILVKVRRLNRLEFMSAEYLAAAWIFEITNLPYNQKTIAGYSKELELDPIYLVKYLRFVRR